MVNLLLPALLALPLASALPAAQPTPPNIPSTADAQSQLAKLTVAKQGSDSDYDRDLFPHWISQGQYVPLPPSDVYGC